MFFSKRYKQSKYIKAKENFEKLRCVLKKEKRKGVSFLFIFFIYFFLSFLVLKSCQKWMQLCCTGLKQAKIRSEKFFADRREEGVGERLEVNSMNWPKNGLKCLGFLIRSS